MSYSYKLNRISENCRFLFLKTFKKNYKLSTDDLIKHNRGDPKLNLDSSRVINQKEILDRYVKYFKKNIIKNNKNMRILDLGCRDGYFLKKLEEYGFKNIKGFEIVPEWVKYCYKNNQKYIKCKNVLDIKTSKYTNKFNFVFSRHTLEHTDQPIEFFKKVMSLSNKGGTIFIVFPLNPNANFKHPCKLKSIEHIKKIFDLSKLDIKYFGFLNQSNNKELELLSDKREKNEVLIYGLKK